MRKNLIFYFSAILLGLSIVIINYNTTPEQFKTESFESKVLDRLDAMVAIEERQAQIISH